MTSQSTSRDEITIQVVYLLMVIVAAFLLAVLTEIVAWWAFGLTTASWHVAGQALLGIAACSGLAGAVRVNRRYHRQS